MQGQSTNGVEGDGQREYRSLIDQVVLVGLARHSRLRSDSHQLRWVTSLRIATEGEQVEPGTKAVEIGNGLFLHVLFCEKDQRPVTKLKSCLRTATNQEQLLPWPAGLACEEGLWTERGGEGRIIEDVEMVVVSGQRELELPEEESYEVVRLPLACQTIPEENSSNEQLVEKTRYLLVRTLDIDDHAVVAQAFQPAVTLRHAFRSAPFLDASTFPDFCFPEGVRLTDEVLGTGYQVLSFILTQEDSSRVYVNCLKFKERLAAEVVETLPSNCVDKHLRERTLLFAERAFCIISRYCHTDFFHGLLEEIFRQYLTLHNALAMRARLEVKSAGCIPYSQAELRFDQVASQFINSYERGLQQAQREQSELQFMRESVKIQMEWFGQRFCFPEPVEEAASLFSPRAVHCLFSVLSVQRVAEVFLALLQERKVFFVSDSQVVLGYVIEALLSFLYPLRWEHVILPILPEKLLQLLDAPVPLIAGIPTVLATDDLICSAKETTVVFLDCNEVISKDRCVQTKEVNHLRQAVKRLRVYDIYSKDHVLQMLALREQFFLFRIHEKESENIFSAEHIKHIFFETMLLFLQGYNSFYSPVPAHSHFNFKRDYRLDEFVRSHPRSLQPFLRRLVQCTHFINFVYKYHECGRHAHKGLIDRALASQKYCHSPSPLKPEAFRLSEQPAKNNLEVNSLRKKASLQPHHNITWSPPPKKSEEVSTNYTRNFDRCSIRLEDVEVEKQQSEGRGGDGEQKTKGGQICETITKAMTNASHTKQNVILWTQARVSRLKRIFTGSSREGRESAEVRDAVEEEKAQKKQSKEQ